MQAGQAGEVGDAPVQQAADMPFQVGAGRDQVPVHRPVHVGRQRQAVARIVVTGCAEGVDVFNQSRFIFNNINIYIINWWRR